MRRYVVIALGLLLGLSVALAGEEVATQPVTPFEPTTSTSAVRSPAAGLSIILTTDRTTVHPGEFLVIRAYYWNRSNARMALPFPSGGIAGQLHIRTPRGVVTYGNASEHPWSPIVVRAVDAGVIRELQGMRLRLSQAPPAARQRYKTLSWYDKKTGKATCPDFRQDGTYRAWIEYEPPADLDKEQRLWAGQARSNEVVFRIRLLAKDQLIDAATTEQIHDLDAMIQGKTDRDRFYRRPHSRLMKAIIEARNEGLAQEMLRRLLAWRPRRPKGRERTPTWGAYFGNMLITRAGDALTNGAGVDGPYLDTLVKALLEHARDSTIHPGFSDVNKCKAVGALVAYVQLHADDKQARSEVVEVLKTWAHLPQPGAGTRVMASAWLGLIVLGVLHDGMRVEEAKSILGEPDKTSDTMVRWRHHWQMRPAPPAIEAEVRDGKVTSFKVFQ